jgi:hypothetical protein
VVVRGSAGASAPTIRFRAVDLSDLFQVLHEATGEDFIVDHDVAGRTDLDASAATAAEISAELRKAGVVVRGDSLHRVSRAEARVELPSQEYTGEPLTLLLQDVSVGDVLCLLGKISGLGVLMSEGGDRRVLVFASEQPWDLLMESVVLSAGLAYRIDGTDVLIGPKGAIAREKARPACGSFSSSRLGGLNLPKLGVGDLELAGLVNLEGEWSAYVYSPFRRLLRVTAGAELFDGKVTRIDDSGVTFGSGAKATRLSLASN